MDSFVAGTICSIGERSGCLRLCWDRLLLKVMFSCVMITVVVVVGAVRVGADGHWLLIQVEPAHAGGEWQLVAQVGGVDPDGADKGSHGLLHHQGLGGDALNLQVQKNMEFYQERENKNTTHCLI